MKKVGILHLSDIHIDAQSITTIDSLVKKLTADIEKVKNENSVNIDLVCFAGDLISRGDMAFENEMQIKLAEKHFIEPLLKSLKISKREFLLVPGNHEVDIRKIAKMTESGLAGMSSLKNINETIYNMEEDYNRRLHYFYDYMFNNYVDDAKKWNLGYSLTREINGVSIGIVGIDSAWRSAGRGYTERGKLLVGEQQVGILFDNVKDTDVKVCLMHHPIDWLSDLEMNNVEKRLNHFDLVLRGHVHDLDDKQICTQRYKTIYNTSGKLYPIDDYYSGYSLIDVDMDLNKCCIYSREYLSLPREDFDKSLRINEEGKTEYFLMSYNREKEIEYDLKLQLKEFYENVAEKYLMLKNIDSFSPDRIGDFFVEPTIYEKSESERVQGAKNEQQRESPMPLENLINNTENIMLIGKRESGKTTLLYQFGIKHTVAGSEKIPIYIDMLNIDKGKERILNACYHFIFSVLSDHMDLNKNHVNNLLDSGNFIFLMDNIQISNADHQKWIYKFTQKYSKNRYVFSVEEKFYQTYTRMELPDLGVTYKSVYLDYFNKRQIREMVTKWGGNKDGFDANEMTRKIVTYCNNINFSMSPFNIAVFMTIWDVDRNFVPINEGKVMRTYLELVLDKLSSDAFQRSEYDFDVKQHFLGCLAYQMYLNDEYYFNSKEFEKTVDEYHETFGFQKSKSNFDKIFFDKNILYLSGENVFFSNNSILEYCLAYHATKENQLYEQMCSKGNRSRFVHELSFYSGIVNDCTPLLDILHLEITETMLDNINILDDIEKISINLEFKSDKDSFKKAIVDNRYNMNELDDMEHDSFRIKNKSPMEIKKLMNSVDNESFMDLLSIYGSAIKNAETANKKQKKFHLDTYILAMNFQFGLIINELSTYLTEDLKVSIPKEIKQEHPDLTIQDYEKIKETVFDLLKITLPIGMQFYIAQNVGSPKLDIIIDELIKENEDKQFTKFMLSFLYCDMGSGNIKKFLKNYIEREASKDILKLILLKLSLYYSLRYFGNDRRVDDMLIDLITEVHMKIQFDNSRDAKIQKGQIKNQIKQKYEAQRNQLAV